MQKQKKVTDKNIPVKELTPELAKSLYAQIQRRLHNQKVAKQAVLHHLKQLKAQMGKAKSNAHSENDTKRAWAIEDCMEMIDKKIKKVNKQL
jgi:hypothetical protein